MTVQLPQPDLEATLTQIDRATEDFIDFLKMQSETLQALVTASGTYDAVEHCALEEE